MAVSGQEDWFNIPELDPVDVTGKRGNNAGFWNFGPNDLQNPYNNPFEGIVQPEDISIPYWDAPAAPVPAPKIIDPVQRCVALGDGSDQDIADCERYHDSIAPEPLIAFAPPMPAPLPEVIVSAPKIAPPAPILPAIISTVARIAAPIVTFLFPTPMGPREFDEAPTPLPVQPEVVVSPPRRVRPPRTNVGTDPILPPNWNDLVDWGVRPFTPGVPVPDFELPPTPAFYPDEVIPELQPFNEPITTPTPNPRYRPAPGDRGAPRISPDPFRPFGPFADPIGSPFGDLIGDPAPDLRPDPTGDPRTLPSPIFSPFPLPFDPVGEPTAAPPEVVPFDPYQPFNPYVPDFAPGPGFAPTPDLAPFPFAPPPNRADPCNCKSCGGDKKKKKKKPKEREICYRGTYRQLRKGISYNKLEEIPCESPSKKKAAPKSRSRRAPVDSLKDLAGSIFGTTNLSPFGS